MTKPIITTTSSLLLTSKTEGVTKLSCRFPSEFFEIHYPYHNVLKRMSQAHGSKPHPFNPANHKELNCRSRSPVSLPLSSVKSKEAFLYLCCSLKTKNIEK